MSRIAEYAGRRRYNALMIRHVSMEQTVYGTIKEEKSYRNNPIKE